MRDSRVLGAMRRACAAPSMPEMRTRDLVEMRHRGGVADHLGVLGRLGALCRIPDGDSWWAVRKLVYGNAGCPRGE